MDIREWSIVASGDVSQRHPWEVARLWSLLKLLRDNGFSPERSFTVLDFGAGDLFVAAGIKRAFPNAVIVSIDSAYDETLVASLRNSGNLESVNAFPTIEQWSPQPQMQADVVLLLDVLEHCPSEVQILNDLKHSGKVKPVALWVVTVPAFQWLFSAHDRFLGHYRRYRLGQLRAVLQGVGFRIRGSGYFFVSLLAPRIFQKVFESIGIGARNPKGLASFRQAGCFGQVIAFALYTDFMILTFLNRFGVRVPGLSCYVVAS